VHSRAGRIRAGVQSVVPARRRDEPHTAASISPRDRMIVLLDERIPSREGFSSVSFRRFAGGLVRICEDSRKACLPSLVCHVKCACRTGDEDRKILFPADKTTICG